MKTFKHILIPILFAAILASCNLPKSTQITGQNPAGTFAAMTLQVISSQTPMTIIVPTNILSTMTASPIPTLTPPNTPIWSAYNYTCELAVSGGIMTMNLSWNDRSNSEEGYKVYRDEQVIATLDPNSTFYVDAAFVAAGKTLSYSVQAFNTSWQVSTSTITYGCQ